MTNSSATINAKPPPIAPSAGTAKSALFGFGSRETAAPGDPRSMLASRFDRADPRRFEHETPTRLRQDGCVGRGLAGSGAAPARDPRRPDGDELAPQAAARPLARGLRDHAYCLEPQNRRAEWLRDWWAAVDRTSVEGRYAGVIAGRTQH